MISENITSKEFFDKHGSSMIRLLTDKQEPYWILVNDLYTAFRERFAGELMEEWRKAINSDDDSESVIRDMIRRMKNNG